MSFEKAKFTAPHLEDIEVGVTYAISINPIDEWHGGGQTLLAWVKKQYNTLRENTHGVIMELYPEASPTMRLHFHGTLVVKDIYGYMKTLKALAPHCTYCIKQITDTEEDYQTDETWHEYCLKQVDIWKPLFKSSIMCYPLQLIPVITTPEVTRTAEGR